MKQGVVYILQCADDSRYTGVTSHLENRLADHHSGRYPGFTQRRRPVQPLLNTDIMDIQDAILLEKQIKGWSRKKKLALINEEWDQLHELSKCMNSSTHMPVSLDSARDDEVENFVSSKKSVPLKNFKTRKLVL
jgi:putative endonuclease